MNLADLNNYLFEQIERVNTDVTGEELDTIIKKAETITKISEQVIKNSDLQYKILCKGIECGIVNNAQISALIPTKDDKDGMAQK